jgi:hypothetical protein
MVDTPAFFLPIAPDPFGRRQVPGGIPVAMIMGFQKQSARARWLSGRLLGFFAPGLRPPKSASCSARKLPAISP